MRYYLKSADLTHTTPQSDSLTFTIFKFSRKYIKVTFLVKKDTWHNIREKAIITYPRTAVKRPSNFDDWNCKIIDKES